MRATLQPPRASMTAAADGCWKRSSARRCATPEKWDSVTRSWKDNVALIGQVSLLLIDEVHMLDEDRGGVLEAVVSRMVCWCRLLPLRL